ncbi:Gfo/Idh/MocA family protein [Verrucomicrobiota bacterium]
MTCIKKNSDMYVLVVGLGSIGTRHLNNLYDLGIGRLSAFRSRNLPPPAELKAEKLEIFMDYDEALASGPDAVVIANPSAFHVPFAKKALEAGCHVYLEKPVSHTLDGTDEIMELACDKNLSVAVGCQLRFHQNLEAIKQWLDADRIGCLISAHIDVGEYLPGWHPWEDYRKSYAARADMGGGVILTLIHEIDYLYWLFGGIDRVYAEGGHLTPLEINVEDTALISMHAKDNMCVHLHMDYWRDPPVRKMNIIGEKGEITWDYYTGHAVLKQKGKVLEESRIDEKWERNDLFVAVMKDFLQSVQEEKLSKIPLTEGVEVLRIALAAKESLLRHEVINI